MNHSEGNVRHEYCSFILADLRGPSPVQRRTSAPLSRLKSLFQGLLFVCTGLVDIMMSSDIASRCADDAFH